ncbi:MAG: hypothetical protein IT388_09965 [Nitrospirales bacterium]|nr:hypothetical protein [Nitrospirales bacterium]
MIVTIAIDTLYSPSPTAKLSSLDFYVQKAQEIAGEGHDVVLTGAGPVWLYLKVAHALHGKARKLIYRSPVTGDVVIFDHSPD